MVRRGGTRKRQVSLKLDVLTLFLEGSETNGVAKFGLGTSRTRCLTDLVLAYVQAG